jgi:hypothetical protein
VLAALVVEVTAVKGTPLVTMALLTLEAVVVETVTTPMGTWLQVMSAAMAALVFA